MQWALAELSLTHLGVAYPGTEFYPLAKNVSVIPLRDLTQIGGECRPGSESV